MKDTIDAFRFSYSSKLKKLCNETDIVNVTVDTIDSAILNISNELFSDGITWCRIIAFSIFITELVIKCISNEFTKSVVDLIYECYSRFVKERLESWIKDHDGWEGVLSLSITEKNEKIVSKSCCIQ